jgi:hypothetical protein
MSIEMENDLQGLQRIGRVVEDAGGWTIRTRDGALAARHEETIAVTRGRPMILTAA